MSTLKTSDTGAEHADSWRVFVSESESVLLRLRAALAEVVAGLPTQVTKPTDLQKALRVDMNVCCKVLKVVSTSGALPAGLHMPGMMALRSFLKGARKAGVAERVVESAARAADEFDRLVSTHADDRMTFDSMISALVTSDDADQITFQHRRATFRGQRHLFGLQVRTHVKCLIVQPGEDERLLDLANLTGFVSLRLLRPTRAPVILSPAYTTNDDGTVRVVHREPLDPAAPDQAGGVSLLRDFCSAPTMRIHSAPAAPGKVIGELIGIGVGNTAAVDCVTGHLNRAAVPRFREAGNRIGGHLAEVRVPCETLLLDLVIREDTCGPLTPQAFTRADHLADAQPGSPVGWERLSPPEPVQRLGKGPSALYAPDYPRYPELARYAFDRLGWDGERFDVYRCRIEYPVLPSTVALFFDLPESPQSNEG